MVSSTPVTLRSLSGHSPPKKCMVSSSPIWWHDIHCYCGLHPNRSTSSFASFLYVVWRAADHDVSLSLTPLHSPFHAQPLQSSKHTPLSLRLSSPAPLLPSPVALPTPSRLSRRQRCSPPWQVGLGQRLLRRRQCMSQLLLAPASPLAPRLSLWCVNVVRV